MKHIHNPIGARVTGRNLPMLYIPNGIAHGCHSLDDEIGISCRMSTPCHPEAAAGLRWGGPTFAVRPPLEVTATAEGVRSRPDLAQS